MEFTNHIPHGASGFLVFGSRAQAELAHCVYDPALYWFQAISKIWKRTVEDYVHRVIEVGLLGVVFQRNLFVVWERRGDLGHQTVARLPLSSSQALRSAARFLANSMSMSWLVAE